MKFQNSFLGGKSLGQSPVLFSEFIVCQQCLHQKNEVEKKLSSLMSQESTSTDSSVLVKHLQEELKHYVSLNYY